MEWEKERKHGEMEYAIEIVGRQLRMGNKNNNN
jgi:hypothetical protein